METRSTVQLPLETNWRVEACKSQENLALLWRITFVVSTALFGFFALAIAPILLSSIPQYYRYGAAALSGLISLALLGVAGFSAYQYYFPPKIDAPKGYLNEVVRHNTNELEIRKFKALINDFDLEDFKNWLLSGYPVPNKKMIFEHVLFPEVTSLVMELQEDYDVAIDFYQCIHTEEYEEFNTEIKVRYKLRDMDFDYENGEGDLFIDFANAHELGGGVIGGAGWAQEEVMFGYCPRLMLLKYIAYKAGQNILPASGRSANKATPFIVPNVEVTYGIKGLYGKQIAQKKVASTKELKKKHIKEFDEPVTVHIGAIAARDWRASSAAKDLDFSSLNPFSSPRYKEKDLRYHFDALVSVFMGFKTTLNLDGKHEIHSGRWGCGVFKNNIRMMVALQLLAARYTDQHLILYRIPLEEGEVQKIANDINACQTIDEAFKYLLAKQKANPQAWAPAIQALPNKVDPTEGTSPKAETSDEEGSTTEEEMEASLVD